MRFPTRRPPGRSAAFTASGNSSSVAAGHARRPTHPEDQLGRVTMCKVRRRLGERVSHVGARCCDGSVERRREQLHRRRSAALHHGDAQRTPGCSLPRRMRPSRTLPGKAVGPKSRSGSGSRRREVQPPRSCPEDASAPEPTCRKRKTRWHAQYGHNPARSHAEGRLSHASAAQDPDSRRSARRADSASRWPYAGPSAPPDECPETQ